MKNKLDPATAKFLLLITFCVVVGVLLGVLNKVFGQTVTPSEDYVCKTPFVRAIIASESSFNPEARSRVGARGLMQLMPSTARSVHKALFGTHLPEHRLTDPYLNVALGTTYLLEMIYEFRDIDLALAAYNAGPGAVKKGFTAKKYIHKIHQLSQP